MSKVMAQAQRAPLGQGMGLRITGSAFQHMRMAELGIEMDHMQVAIGTLMIMLSYVTRPANAVRKARAAIRYRMSR